MASIAFELRAHTHLLTIAGSRAYGLHRPGSDVDVKGFAIPPRRYLLGWLRRFEQVDDADGIGVFADDLRPDEREVVARTKLEGSVYALDKFARLAADCNPHVLDALFCRDDEVRLCTPIGHALRANRRLFLSRRARHSFGGYAAAQLKRIEGHRRWLREPPRKPRRADFGLPEQPVLDREQLNAAEAAADAQQGGRPMGLGDDFIGLMKRERAYRSAKAGYRQYQRWLQERNPERAALEARHGYDTKHGAHLVRLLTMAVELVETGELHVWRGGRDRDTLLAIRDGAWSYERLIAWTNEQEARLAASADRAPLPDEPDREALDALVVDLVGQTL